MTCSVFIFPNSSKVTREPSNACNERSFDNASDVLPMKLIFYSVKFRLLILLLKLK